MRTTKEVFENHIMLVLDWEQELDVEKNYSSECCLLTSIGMFHGHDGVRRFYKIMNEKCPEADYLYFNRMCCGEVAFLEWQAESAEFYIEDAAESFLIRNGQIVSQTVHFTVRSRGQ